MSIPAYIMAVPWDIARVRRAKQIRAVAGNTTIVWDQTKNAMDTFRLLLERVVADGDGAFFIFEDDVMLADNWREKAEYVVAQRPHMICQFFSMEKEASAKELGSRECKGDGFISNLCVYVPAGYASQLLAHSYVFVEKFPKEATANDYVIRHWLKTRKETYWMQYPNLVQHEGWVSSIHPRRPRNRRSNFWDGK